MADLTDIRFAVYQRPVPKGNHAGFPIARARCEACKPGKRCGRRNCFGGVIVGVSITDDGGAELKAWEELVRVSAISARNRAAARVVESPGSVEVRLVFLVPRPAGHYTSRGQLSAEGERKPMPSSKPDWDKLSRSTVDGLTGAIVADDAQVTEALVTKVWAPRAGVLVRARAISRCGDWAVDELAIHGLPAVGAAQGALL